jgi:RNA polymerase sigma factor (sigma-70 family)
MENKSDMELVGILGAQATPSDQERVLAFVVLHDRYMSYLLNYVKYHYYGTPTWVAECIMEDVMTKTYYHILNGHWTGACSFKTFITTVAKNLIIDKYRSERNAPTLESLEESFNHKSDEKADDSLLATELMAAVHNVISGESDRDIAILIAYINGDKYKEIAEQSKVSLANVKTIIHRLKNKLRDHLNIYFS